MANDTSILLRLPAELKEQVEAQAAREHRSVQQQLRHWIEMNLTPARPTLIEAYDREKQRMDKLEAAMRAAGCEDEAVDAAVMVAAEPQKAN